MAKYCIGIDLGGTYVKFGLLDERHRLVEVRQLRTPQGAEAVIEQMACGARQLIDEHGLAGRDVLGVGIGSPGPLDLDRGIIIAMPNISGMENTPIRDRVAEKLSLPAVLDNDANCAAFGEHLCGGGRDGRDMVLLTLGTGVGSGIIVDGKVLHGAHGVAGEIGHIMVDPGGEQCGCGQRGCLERYCSATFIARWATRLIESEGRDGLLAAVLKQSGSINSRDIQQAAAAGDELAMEIWDSAAYYLAVGCINICRTLDPHEILLGGGLANSGDALLAPVRKHFTSLHWKLTGQLTHIDLAQLGNDAGAIGAAGLAWAAFGEQA